MSRYVLHRIWCSCWCGVSARDSGLVGTCDEGIGVGRIRSKDVLYLCTLGRHVLFGGSEQACAATCTPDGSPRHSVLWVSWTNKQTLSITSLCTYKVSMRGASRNCLSSARRHSVHGPFLWKIYAFQSSEIKVVEFHVNIARIPGRGRRGMVSRTLIHGPNASGRAMCHVQLIIFTHACISFKAFIGPTTTGRSWPRWAQRWAKL